MKTKILVGAVAALLYGGVALAENKDCPPGYNKDTQANMGAQTGDQSMSVIETEPVDESIGGSGSAGMDQNQNLGVSGQSNVDQGLGGSSQAGQGSVILRCDPVQGGSGIGGSGYQSEPLRESQVTPPAAPRSDAFTPTIDDEDVNQNREANADMRGLTLLVGGGVEGYTGALAPQINPGATYGVTAAIKPSKVFGLELGYSGAVNNLDAAGGDVGGPDLVRNGGQAALTFGLGAAPVQPYVLGGIGFSDYNFRGEAAGFSDDMVGNVPVGAGLRTHVGDFTFDLRGNYNFLFDQDFAGVDDGLNENGRYAGTLNIGGTF